MSQPVSGVISPDAWKIPWNALLAPYGRQTGDNRTFAPGSIDHRNLPLPLMYQTSSGPNHNGSVIVGTIQSIVSNDEGIFGFGDWLDPALVPEVWRALAVSEAGVGSISADLEPGTFTVTATTDASGREGLLYDSGILAGATIVPVAAFGETRVQLGEPTAAGLTRNEDGTFALSSSSAWRGMAVASRETPFDVNVAVRSILAWAGQDDAKARSMFLWFDPKATPLTQDRYRMPIGFVSNGKPTLVFHAIYAAAAILSGAHGGIKVATEAEQAGMRRTITEIYKRLATVFKDPALEAPWDKRAKLPVTASAGIAPLRPPASWFTDDGIDGPLEVTPEGRVRGLLAPWNMCHTALRQYGNCTKPPKSHTGYQVFRTGSVVTREGSTIPVGRLTMDTVHPTGPVGSMLTASQTAAHYDNTGNCVAVVAAGENEHGIWVSGSLVPEADSTRAAALRRSALSGDWRDVGGQLELVAALAVNSPGFPVVRINGGRIFSLTASGGVALAASDPDVDNGAMSGSEETGTEPQSTDATAAGTETVDAGPDVDAIVGRVIDELTDRAGVEQRFQALRAVEWNDSSMRLDSLPNPEETE